VGGGHDAPRLVAGHPPSYRIDKYLPCGIGEGEGDLAAAKRDAQSVSDRMRLTVDVVGLVGFVHDHGTIFGLAGRVVEPLNLRRSLLGVLHGIDLFDLHTHVDVLTRLPGIVVDALRVDVAADEPKQ
jgi:hypothetical protein